MRIAIVDNDIKDRHSLRRLCEQWGGERRIILSIMEYDSGEGFLAAYEKDRYELIFLDIYMDEIDGIETATRLRGIDINCLLVFLTSSQEHMSSAFPCHAFDYVTKPPTPERLFRLMDDVAKKLPKVCRYLELPFRKQVAKVYLSEIVSAVSEGHYAVITLRDGTAHRCRMTFSRLYAQLCLPEDTCFLDLYKGVLANLEYIEQVVAGACVMRGGSRLPIRLREQAKVERAVTAYHFARLRAGLGVEV